MEKRKSEGPARDELRPGGRRIGLIVIAVVLSAHHLELLRGLDLTLESHRMLTFQQWPFPTQDLQPGDMAASGFFYLGNLDRVQCFSCGGVLKNWKAKDNVTEVHKKHFPHCRMSQRTPLIPEDQATTSQHHRQTNDFFSASRREHSLAGKAISRTSSSSSNYPPYPSQWRPATVDRSHKRFMRINEKSNRRFTSAWPTHRSTSPRNMARAGRFYLGSVNRTQCFICGRVLNTWRRSDDPAVEHLQHFPESPMTQENHPCFVPDHTKTQASTHFGRPTSIAHSQQSLLTNDQQRERNRANQINIIPDDIGECRDDSRQGNGDSILRYCQSDIQNTDDEHGEINGSENRSNHERCGPPFASRMRSTRSNRQPALSVRNFSHGTAVPNAHPLSSPTNYQQREGNSTNRVNIMPTMPRCIGECHDDSRQGNSANWRCCTSDIQNSDDEHREINGNENQSHHERGTHVAPNDNERLTSQPGGTQNIDIGVVTSSLIAHIANLRSTSRELSANVRYDWFLQEVRSSLNHSNHHNPANSFNLALHHACHFSLAEFLRLRLAWSPMYLNPIFLLALAFILTHPEIVRGLMQTMPEQHWFHEKNHSFRDFLRYLLIHHPELRPIVGMCLMIINGYYF